MKTITINTADLSGPALDWAVAKVEGVNAVMFRARKEEQRRPLAIFGSLALSIGGDNPEYSYSPSSCWHCGGPLLHKHRVSTEAPGASSGFWTASMPGSELMEICQGETPLVSGCRRLVLEYLGDTVDVPNELAEVQP